MKSATYLALAAGLVCLAASGAAMAQSPSGVPPVRPTERDLPPMTDRQLAEIAPLLNPFFEQLVSGDARGAFTQITEGVMADPGLVAQLIAVAEQLTTGYGGVKRWELAESRCFTPDICRNTYVLHTGWVPVFFILGLYRHEDGTWAPTQMNLTDQAGQVF